MSVSVDGFITDREGAFAWTAPRSSCSGSRVVHERYGRARAEPH